MHSTWEVEVRRNTLMERRNAPRFSPHSGVWYARIRFPNMSALMGEPVYLVAEATASSKGLALARASKRVARMQEGER
jgi:hypothetical protein